MFKGPEFYGSTTVGERGQIVLPAKLRKKLSIKTGTKFLVISGMGPLRGIMLMRAELLNEMLTTMGENIDDFREKIRAASGKRR